MKEKNNTLLKIISSRENIMKKAESRARRPIEITERYSAPTKHESAPYATITKVITGMSDEETYSFYIQTSKNEEKPHWIPMAEFLETALQEMFYDPAFIEETTLMYQMANIKKKSFFDH